MIDAATGELTIPGLHLKVAARTDPDLLQALSAVKGARAVQMGGAWLRLTFPVQVSEGGRWAIALLFEAGALREVHLSLVDGTTWSEWSDSNLAEKKRKHDVLLTRVLGEPPYKFSWGTVESIADRRAGDSEIVVRYR